MGCQPEDGRESNPHLRCYQIARASVAYHSPTVLRALTDIPWGGLAIRAIQLWLVGGVGRT